MVLLDTVSKPCGLPREAFYDTLFGARGLEANDGQEVLVSELSEFPETITILSNNDDQRQTIGNRARRLAKRQYTWEASSQTLINFLQTQFDLN
uniref:glycosyltransferase n=1 Tax=Halobaculum gomorrense TaxID=43928 RepID=UPI00373FD682